jgi:hypothetical protein
MTRLNQIQQALLAIDPGKFQKLCDLILRRKSRYQNLKPLGSVLGADKTSAGVPDSLIVLPEGGYASAAYTTTSDRSHAKLIAKLHGDVADSFDESKTRVPASEVHEVILCHTGRLDAGEIHALIEEGKGHNAVVHVNDLHALSLDLYYDPGLVRDQLGLPIDTAQILTPADWVARYNKNAFATRIDTIFHFRTTEGDRALAALERCDLVIFSGKPGVGKTRFMLEVGARFTRQHPEYASWCIFNRGANIFDDVRAYFSADGHYLILLDDANRLNAALSYFLQLLPEQRDKHRIKILVTVRGYALEKIRTSLHRDGIGEYEEVVIERFTDEEIRKLVADETIIKNQDYLDRISRLAQGNPRLAMMAAAVAAKANTLESIANAEALYEEYFRSIRDDLEVLANTSVIKVAGIVAFFRLVDRSNEVQMSLIAAAFAISPDEFWLAAEELHERELLDIYENEVVRSADQVLATYLFYYAVFRRKLLPLSEIFAYFFPQHRSLIVEALNPALEAFGATMADELRPEADAEWAIAVASGDHSRIEEFIRLFWFLKETETLLYIREYIASLVTEEVDVSSLDFDESSGSGEFPLSILGKFVMRERVEVAVSLVCDFAAKRPSALPAVLYVLAEDLGFRPHSPQSEYALQRAVLSVLWQRAEEGQQPFFARLYLRVARAYLHVQHQFIEPGGRMSINITTFVLPGTAALTALRREIIAHVCALYAIADMRAPVLGLIHRYASGGAFMASTEMIVEDSQQLLRFIAEFFDPGDLQVSEVAHEYFEFLRREGIEVPEEVQGAFATPAAVLKALLVPDSRDQPGKGVEEFQAWQEQRLAQHCKDFTLPDYRELFIQAAAIQPEPHAHGRWQFDGSISFIFDDLATREPRLFVAIVAMYLELGNPLRLLGYAVVHRLVSVSVAGVVETEQLLRSHEYQRKEQWLFVFYACIPPSDITAVHLANLRALYRNAPLEEILSDFRYIEKYENVNAGALSSVVSILMKRRDESFIIGRLLANLFRPNMTSGFLIAAFQESVESLKAAYFLAEAADPHVDYDGHAFSAILDLDRSFLRESLQEIIQKMRAQGKRWLSEYADERNYDFLWRREDFEQLVREVLDELFTLRTGAEPIFVNDYPKVFFGLRHLSASQEPLLLARRVPLLRALIRQRIKDRAYIKFLFELISDFPDEEKRELLATLLENDQDAEVFRSLQLLPRHHTYVGSAVPMIQREVDFLESLLPLVNTVALLEQHAALEARIGELREWMDREKKRDFLNDT